MLWQDIRQHYPDQWLLIEALRAHSEGNQRILDELVVLGAFPDSVPLCNATPTSPRGP